MISKRGFRSPWGPRQSPSKGEALKEVLEGRGEPPPRERGLWTGSLNFSFPCQQDAGITRGSAQTSWELLAR